MSYGFGIVGLGLIADFHAKAIRAMEGGRLVAGYSSFPKEVEAFTGKYGCRGYTDLDEFLADPELQIVTICTPSGAHLEPALAAAKAGRHVICEKPLEMTLERCDRIIAACAAGRGAAVRGLPVPLPRARPASCAGRWTRGASAGWCWGTPT